MSTTKPPLGNGLLRQGKEQKMNDHKQTKSHEGEWRLAFAGDGSGDWRAKWFLDGDTATVENTPQGMILRAGPDIKDNGDSMVLWTRDRFVGDVKIDYEFTRHDRAVEGVNIIDRGNSLGHWSVQAERAVSAHGGQRGQRHDFRRLRRRQE